MFEYHYCVALEVVHPSADPTVISEAFKAYRVTNETMAGTERSTRAGRLIEPRRKAVSTHWAADLHDDNKIFSGSLGIEEFIHRKLKELQAHRGLLLELGKEGEVVLKIGWFSESNHSAASIGVEVLRRCADLGLGIELNFYGPDEPD